MSQGKGGDLPLLTATQRKEALSDVDGPVIVVSGSQDEGAVLTADSPVTTQDVGLKRQIGLLGSIALLIGAIIGSGIFASPKTAALYSGSSGMLLMVWVICGGITILGALTWCELSLMFPNACGNFYTYIYEAFGEFPAFVVMYLSMLGEILSITAISMVTGDYVMTAIVGSGNSVYSKAIGALVIGINMLVNCTTVKFTEIIQKILLCAKMIPIIMLVVTGFVRIGEGHVENLTSAFNGTSTNIGDISLALYAGLFAYGGWHILGTVVAETLDPVRNIPLAAYIGIPVIIVCYVTVNMAYLTVKTRSEIAQSDAIAVDIGKEMYGVMHWVIPTFVACSCFGVCNIGIFICGRSIYEAANRGHFPKLLGAVHIKRHIPVPAIIVPSVIAWLVLIPESSNFTNLLNYILFFEWAKLALTIFALLWMRKARPNIKRPFKVFIGIPILLFVISLFLILAPFFRQPVQQAYGVCIMLLSIPLYLAFVKYQIIPRKLRTKIDVATKKIEEFGNLAQPDFKKCQDVELERTS